MELSLRPVSDSYRSWSSTSITNYPIKVVNTDRETLSSVSAKLRKALADIESLKKRVRALEAQDQD